MIMTAPRPFPFARIGGKTSSKKIHVVHYIRCETGFGRGDGERRVGARGKARGMGAMILGRIIDIMRPGLVWEGSIWAVFGSFTADFQDA